MSAEPLSLDPNRFFPVTGKARSLARSLYETVADAPIISPHGHTDPAWFADNANFKNATEFLLVPDHYVLRMLYSQGIALDDLGVAPRGERSSTDPRQAWRLFAQNYHLFRGTPSRIWMDHVFSEVFGINVCLSAATADTLYDTITDALQTPAYRPRALMDRFGVKFLATTEGALDPLMHHAKIIQDGWGQRVVTTFRPDDVIDAGRSDFVENVEKLAELTGEDTATWTGYLAALRNRRLVFKAHGATATDHGHPSAHTENLSADQADQVFQSCLSGNADAKSQERFRGQMLTEMAKMSLDDGLVMQLHPGVFRDHNRSMFERFGTDKGADIPLSTDFVNGLKPLLDVVGHEPNFKLILFTLDETTYARELAPLAGHYPCLLVGPPWWFNDSPEGMIRFRRQVTETAGFYNTAGFNDDTRAFLSIPARHDLARRMDCRFLAELVGENRLAEYEAFEVIQDLTVNLVRNAYNISSPNRSQSVVAE